MNPANLPTVCLTVLACTAACTDPSVGPRIPDALDAKGRISDPTVDLVDPAFGHQGDNGFVVTVSGGGFDAGSQVSWERNGAPDSKITVFSTEFLSSSQLKATINIAADADVARYDVAVTTAKGRKGIGTELFEVTQAIALDVTTLIRAVNQQGEMTGQSTSGAFVWSLATGMEILRSSGSGWDISEDGHTIVGGDYIWSRSGASWAEALLPRGAGSGSVYATSIASDMDGAAAVIGGAEDMPGTKKNPGGRQPRLWLREESGWLRIALPTGAGTPIAFVNDLSDNNVAVGYLNNAPVVWTPDGLGGWSLTYLGPAATSGSRNEAKGVNRTASLIAGIISAKAVYWQRSGTGWSAPITLPVSCGTAVAVDDLNRILVRGCDLGSGTNVTSAVVSPPYLSADALTLGGFGDRADGPQVWAISRHGTWIVGSSKLKTATIGAYWNVF
ncbi:MAG TPA: hypothetical protein VJU15_16030 [Gemmatimonadales bacterium]|nr:hypothetical protein [Gemmatimonadales bacterium]